MTDSQSPNTELRFDPANHKYFVGNTELISVTTVLREANIISTIGYNEEARQRGKAVHEAIHYDDLNDLDTESVDESIWPYISAWRKFCEDAETRFDMIEGPVFNEIWEFAGTPDRVGTLNGRPVIIDVKTGSIPNWAGLQTAAYGLCLGGTFTRFGLQLKDDGKYLLKEFNDKSDEKVFLSALAIVNWKRNN